MSAASQASHSDAGMEHVPVLIIGASLVGLTTAALLRQHGVEVLAVERHSGTAIRPRAGHFHLRTVEILRSMGLEETVRASSGRAYPPNGGISNVESLAGREIENYFDNLNAGVDEFSPTIRLFLNQDDLEPILRKQAETLGAKLRYHTECIDLASDAEGVTATVRDLQSGRESRVRADYVVAADGNRSPVRERAGIAMRGHGLLSNSVTIYFHADTDMAPLLAGRNQGVQYVTNSVLRGFFRLDRAGNGGFLVVNLIGDSYRPEIVNAYPDAGWSEVSEGMTEARALELLRAAIGIPNMPVTVKDIAPWHAVADVAERFVDGRVFLAGDAAHTVPPNGGFGGNTGIQDAHNLAWKLALVLHGVAGPALLNTYDAERQPIGELTIEQAYSRYVTRVAPYLGTAGMQSLVDDFSMEIGYCYTSPAITADAGADAAKPVLHLHPREAHGRPGSRAPHVWVERGGKRCSTLDLFNLNFVLLVGPDGQAWCDATAKVADGASVDTYCVGSKALPDPDGSFAAAYGISSGGAVLVRPDGVVAWRSSEPASESVLRAVLNAALCRASS